MMEAGWEVLVECRAVGGSIGSGRVHVLMKGLLQFRRTVRDLREVPTVGMGAVTNVGNPEMAIALRRRRSSAMSTRSA